VRLLQLSRRDEFAHARGRNRHAVRIQHARHGKHLERARVLKRRHIARAPMPEPKVVADDHGAGVQALHQRLFDERRRAELRERLRERLHDDHIDAQALQFLHAVRQRAQHRRASVGREYGGGVRFEGQRDGGRIVRPRPAHGRLHQRRVPAMHAVKHAQRRRAPVGERSPHTLHADHPAHP
jgi:hypothetical protein